MSVYKGYAYDNLAINNPQLHNPTLTGTMTNSLTANAAPQVITVTDPTYTVTANDHDKIITLNRAAGVTVTLPTPTGSYRKYTFVVGTTVTSNAHIIKVALSAHYIGGMIAAYDGFNALPVPSWFSSAGSATDDTITLSATTTGNPIAGFTYLTLVDMLSTRFFAHGVVGSLFADGGSFGTPFSATVS